MSGRSVTFRAAAPFFAAMPPDVRKVCDLPDGSPILRGYAA